MDEDGLREEVVFRTDDSDLASSCSLVLSAMKIGHRVSQQENIFLISVDLENVEEANHHLEAYFRENKNWPPPRLLTEQNTSTIQPPTLLVIGVLIIFYTISGPWTDGSSLFTDGAGDSTAILNNGEYFRLITPLFLHADLTHLLSNCLLGGFLLHFFCRSTGPGLGLLATLVTGALGNWVNVYLHGENHLFIGFSTAVFGLIGLLAMLSLHSKRKLSNLQVVLPLMAGAGLLAITGGAGAERVDFGAHVFGLISGLLIGRLLITDYFIRLRNSSRLQLVFFLITLIIVYTSWDSAISHVH